MPPLDAEAMAKLQKCQNHTPLACAVAVISRSRSGADQSRALMMRALLPSSSVNQSLTNILMCGVIACVFGRRCGGSATCSGFVKGFVSYHLISPCP